MIESQMSLTRSAIRKLVKSEHGGIARIAAELGITSTTVSMVLKGRGVSSRVMAAATAYAHQILERRAA
jgi:predicted GNAT family acetyltransferase